MSKTIFCDIDGVLFWHHGQGLSGQTIKPAHVLPQTREKINRWQSKGHFIVLTTGRKESQRKETEKQLQHAGLFWDHLVMGLPRGQRVVINDLKPGKTPENASESDMTARAICVARNSGLARIDIDPDLPTESRPWGKFWNLHDDEKYKIKRIEVDPGQCPSYQVHAKRDEHWIVVSGTGTVRLDDKEIEVDPEDHVNIKAGQPHTISCTSGEPLVFIEVQTGSYFGEDDITRLEDKYGRV